jgi:hypothetical protein
VISLTQYSALAQKAILEHLPALVPQLREQPDGSLFLELLSPSGCKFWISTEGQEVTVGFDAHHVHFGTPWEPDADADARDAIEYIHKLMCGQYRVAVWSRDGKFVQSETIERGVNPAEVSRSCIARWWLNGCSVAVYGW